MTNWSGSRMGGCALLRRAGPCAALLLCAAVAPAAAQKDYYNTDKNRPLRIENAYTTERHVLELKLASLRLERQSGGVYHWGFDPEIAYGILPRTSVEIGFPIAFIDGGESTQTSGLGGIEVSLFHNLNHETRTLPALGARLDAALPVGSLAPDRVYLAITGIATRTYGWGRVHVNGQYTFGSAPEDATPTAHAPLSWLGGVAVDRAFPLNSWLLTGEVYVARPLHAEDPMELNTAGGIRYQVSPYLAVDAGVGRTLTGNPGWRLIFGSAYHVGIRALMPLAR